MKYQLAYVDVNVYLDFMCNSRDAEDKKLAFEFFSLGDFKKISICTNASTLAFAKSFLRKEYSEKQAKEMVRDSLRIIQISPSNQKIVDEALASDFLDWEDAMHYYSAFHYGADCIITRNTKDFKHSKIPILTPKQFIQNYLNNQ